MTNLLDQRLQQKYQNAKILIAGFGREGESTYRRLRQIFPSMVIGVCDQQSISAEVLASDAQLAVEPYLQNLEQYDVVFKTPGISQREAALEAFVATGKTMTSQLQEFFEVYRDHCVGVTGTKGKSTTSSLIFHLLKETGSDVVFAGNIGRPVFELRDELSSETQIVLELSSYQLESLTVSPHIAVWLNIFSEHLNYHGTFAQYVAAKSHITQFQTAEDILIYNAESPEVAAASLRSAAQKQAFWPSHPLAAEVTDALPATVASVVRQHNLPAALLAVNAVTPLTTEQLTHALATFQPLAHRLETIGTFRGIRFVDDTLATIPEASISALAAFPETQVMLLGGFDRGIDYTSIVDEVVARHVPTVIFFRPSGEKMQQILEQKYPAEQRPQVFFAENMQEAVTLAYQHAQPGGVVLLSPASPSYGHFKNYEDKSAQFVQWVKQLAADAPET